MKRDVSLSPKSQIDILHRYPNIRVSSFVVSTWNFYRSFIGHKKLFLGGSAGFMKFIVDIPINLRYIVPWMFVMIVSTSLLILSSIGRRRTIMRFALYHPGFTKWGRSVRMPCIMESIILTTDQE